MEISQNLFILALLSLTAVAVLTFFLFTALERKQQKAKRKTSFQDQFLPS